jgi:hypothetical protein
MGTPTSIVLRWRTSAPTDGLVRYGTTPEDPDLVAADPVPTTEHEIELTGLAPATTYHYWVGTTAQALVGGPPDHLFLTPPAPGTPAPTRVWVLGDSGTANADAAAVRDAYMAFTGPIHTDLWLMLGDNAYDDGTDSEYQDAVFEMYPAMLRRSVLWPTLGNHDGISADSSSQTGPYYDIFTLPAGAEAGGIASGTEAYYSFDHANIHFVCLDSHESDRSPGGLMLTWLQEDLAATAQDWVIAFWHHPPYSKGSHDSDSETQLAQMRQNVLPILEDAGADLVLAGHSHSYERSVLLDGHYGQSSTLQQVMVKDAGDGRVDGDGAYSKASAWFPHEGAVYVVAGSSGKVSSAALDHPAMILSLETLGSVVLDVQGLELHATFLDDLGAVRDEFTIVKGTGTVPAAPAGLAATAVSQSRIDLSWTDESSDEAGFEVGLSPDGLVWFPLGSVGAAVTYSHTGLSPATSCVYRVRAFNGAGESPWSGVAAAVTAFPSSEDAADDDLPEAGTVHGDFHDTEDDDSVYEWIEEEESNGNPANRYSFLEHVWTFDVTGGDAVTFLVNAYKTPSSDGDDFVFAWSSNGSSYADMVTVTNTSDTGAFQQFSLPDSLDGSIYVRVRDTDRTPGHQSLDRIHVDRMFIRSENSSSPPAAPMFLAASAVSSQRVDLTWADFAATEDGFEIERSSGGAGWALIAQTGADLSAWSDTTVAPLTSYSYRVRSFNGFGASQWSAAAQAATAGFGPSKGVTIGTSP